MNKELFDITTKLLQCKFFHIMSVSKRKEKTPILMNKLLYLGLPILELSKMTFMSFGMIM